MILPMEGYCKHALSTNEDTRPWQLKGLKNKFDSSKMLTKPIKLMFFHRISSSFYFVELGNTG